MKYNLLIDELPTTVEVGSKTYDIESNFRTSILCEMLLQDREISDEQKAITMLDLYFGQSIPNDIEGAFDAIIWFYRGGDEPEQEQQEAESEQPTPPIRAQRVYDYDIDAPLIYAAFQSQYGIDLNAIEYLHWWKFLALFQSLHEDELIAKIIGYRSADLSKIKDKDTRNRYAALKRRYALPNPMTNEEKIAMAGSVFAGGRR